MRRRWIAHLLAAGLLGPLAWSCGDDFTRGAGGAGGAGGSAACTADGDCAFLNGDCREGRCVNDKCELTPANEGGPCDDGLDCTEGDVCANGVCGTPVQCTQPPDPCQHAICVEELQGCVVEPGNHGSPCDDGDPCTEADVCAAGSCQGEAVSTCQDGDGCCPEDCTASNDHECACLDNLALQATADSSGGGTDGMGPAKMNDGVGAESCQNHWIYNDPNSVDTWIQLDFPQEVSIASLYVATENATNPVCAGSPGRNIESGHVQVWDGDGWVTVASFSGETDDVQVDFTPTTTKGLRIYGVTCSPGNTNSMIFEWYVYGAHGCEPVPPAG